LNFLITPINLRLNVKNGGRDRLNVLVKVQTESNGIEKSTLQACFTLVNGKNGSCFDLKFNSMGIGNVNLPDLLSPGKLEKFTVNLKNKENFNLSGWGVVIQSDN
jgi:hypothetical protein